MDSELRADKEERLGKYKMFENITDLLNDLHDRVSGYYVCPVCGLIFYPAVATEIHCIGNS
jgi:rubrerythrin